MSNDLVNNEYEVSIEQIAASLAHEVKNPISLVRANLDLLELNDTLHEFTKNYVMMRRELDRINDLITDFISFAKPYEKIAQDVDIKEIISSLIEEMSTALNGVSFNLSVTGNKFIISGDLTKIKNVFDNIFKNAVEAMDYKGEIKAHIYTEGGYVVVSVSDSGCGIEDIKKVTEAFYTTKENGSGLGLFISGKTIADHNGKLLIENNEERGCRVTVKLLEKK